MGIHINDTIKVQLTETGKAILKHRYDDLIARFPRLKEKLVVKTPDSEGFYFFTFWDLMNLFGEHMWPGEEVAFTEVVFAVDKPEGLPPLPPPPPCRSFNFWGETKESKQRQRDYEAYCRGYQYALGRQPCDF